MGVDILGVDILGRTPERGEPFFFFLGGGGHFSRWYQTLLSRLVHVSMYFFYMFSSYNIENWVDLMRVDLVALDFVRIDLVILKVRMLLFYSHSMLILKQCGGVIQFG